jgi:methyl coenzyme M reductase subunit C
MGVHQPQQAQEPDEDNLAEDRIAVDEEGNGAAYNGSFDQIKNSHVTAFMFSPGRRRL